MISVRSDVTLTFDEKERAALVRDLTRLLRWIDKTPDASSEMDMEVLALSSLVDALKEPKHA